MSVRLQFRRGTEAEWFAADTVLGEAEIGYETDTKKIKVGNGITSWNSLSYVNVVPSDLVNTLNDYVLVGDVGNPGGPAKLDSEGNLLIPKASIILEGPTANDYETTLTVANPTADRTITFKDESGTVALLSDIDALIDGAPNALNTLNELSAALGDDANYASTITNALGALTQAGFTHAESTTQVHGIADVAQLATKAYADNSAYGQASSQVGTHNTTETNVHGISNTANLMYKTGAVMTGDLTLNGDPDYDMQASTKKYVDDHIDTHNASETNVHGIADTADLATKLYVDNAGDALQDNIDLKAPIESPTFTGTVSGITATMVGLANVDNTSDANKPVSTATQTALDLKANIDSPTFTGVATTNDLIVDGDFTINGTNFAASATSIVISDNMVQLAHQNAANTVDLGLIVGYNDGTTKHSGIVRDVSDNKWKIFKGVTTEPSTTVDFTEGSLDDLKVAAFEATTVTPSEGIVFSDGTQTKEGVPSRTPIIYKTGSYTLSSLTERDSLIEVDSTDPVTITIPEHSSVAFPVGTTLDILQTNTGLVTIAGYEVEGIPTVTVNATPGKKLRTQWSSVTLFKRAENSWVVYGDLKE